MLFLVLEESENQTAKIIHGKKFTEDYLNNDWRKKTVISSKRRLIYI